jgi:redox-sensitive bicupin YhaK (pirin superfamily)
MNTVQTTTTTSTPTQPAPQLTVRRSDERGRADFGWLQGRHSFAFGHWRPRTALPHAYGFRTLRVINDDHIGPARDGGGFAPHPHHDMEIITYVTQGALAHADSTGAKATIVPGDIQRMTAGRGIVHSEFNASPTEPAHLLQIWIQPQQAGLTPGYAQINVPDTLKRNTLRLVGAPHDSNVPEGAIPLHTDARLYAGVLDDGREAQIALAPGRHAWLQIVRGGVRVIARGADGQSSEITLQAGDGLAISDAHTVHTVSHGESELLAFDLP